MLTYLRVGSFSEPPSGTYMISAVTDLTAPTRADRRASPIGLGLLVFVALLAITSIPYAFGAWSAPADHVYTGLMFDVIDHAQYWSWVTASRHGLFIANTMTPEPHAATFIQPLMWSLSRIQVAFGLSFSMLFQLWRVAALLLITTAVLLFVRTFLVERQRRTTALWLALAGAGFGWVLVVIKFATGTADVPWPADLYMVDTNTFFVAFAYPNIALSHALLLLAMVGVLRAHERGHWSAYLLTATASLALALAHAYDLQTLWSATGAFALWLWFRRRRMPGRLVLAGVVSVGVSAPMALYYWRLTRFDPIWREVLSQYGNLGFRTPTAPHLLILMGAPLLLAVLCVATRIGRAGRVARTDNARHREADATDGEAFAMAWALATPLLINQPSTYADKLINGWQFPLAVLAACAWHDRVSPPLERWFANRLPATWTLRPVWTARLLLLALVLPTTVYLYTWRLVDLGRHRSAFYLHRDDLAALDWLATHHTPEDVVLADLAFGQWAPNYGQTRAFLAHPSMTNRFAERVELVRRFFSGGETDAWRDRLLRTEGVTLVVCTEAAWVSAPGYDPGTSRLFEPLFVSPHTQVYRVRR